MGFDASPMRRDAGIKEHRRREAIPAEPSHNRVAEVSLATLSAVPNTATMPNRPLVFHFDFVDPGSRLAAHLIDEAGVADAVEWRGFELRPPPRPLIDPTAPDWQTYHARTIEFARGFGVPMATPQLVPWTRKAHELAEFAREGDCDHTVRRALFEAHFVDLTDIGRIDLLVEIAHRAGLDRTEAKAVLDVDRYTDAVLGQRAAARTQGVTLVPALVAGGRRLEGLATTAELARWTRWIRNELTAETWE